MKIRYWRFLIILQISISLTAIAKIAVGDDAKMPPIPFETSSALPGDGGYPFEMMATIDAAALRDYRNSSTLAFPISKGQRVIGLDGVVVTTKLGRVRVLKPCPVGGVMAKPRESVYTLYDSGEGWMHAWFRGRKLEFNPYEPATCFKEEERPVYSWLVKTRDAQGRQGWVNPDNFLFSQSESSGTLDMLDADWLSLSPGQSLLNYTSTTDGRILYWKSTPLGNKVFSEGTRLLPERILVSGQFPDLNGNLLYLSHYVIACDRKTDNSSCNTIYKINQDGGYKLINGSNVFLVWQFVVILDANNNALYRVDMRNGESRRLQYPNLRTGYTPVITTNSVALSLDKKQLTFEMKQNCLEFQQGCLDELKTSHVMSVNVVTWEAREVAKQSPGLLTLPFAVGETWHVCRSYNGPDVHQGRASLDLSIDPRSPGRTGCTPDTASSSKDKVVLSPASGLVLAHFNGEPKDMLCLLLDEKRDVNSDGTPDELFLKIGHLQGMPPEKSRVERGARLGTLTTPSTGNGGYSHIHIELVTGDLSTGSGCSKAAIRVPFSGELVFQGAPDLPYDGRKNQWQGIPLSR